MAGFTKNVKLGTMVTGSINRPPGVLMKIVTTLDVLSGGRAILGIGSGGFRRECLGFGIPFIKSRGELVGRFRETIEIANKMWSGDSSPYVGKYYKLDEPLLSPMPLSKPHPPIMIAGSGEKMTLKLVAKYGDWWNFHHGAHPKLPGYSDRSYNNYKTRFERVKRSVNVLKKHCQRENRNFEEIEITTLCPIKLSEDVMTPEDVIEICEDMAGLGVHHIIFNMSNDHEITPIKTIGEKIVPQVSKL